MFAIIIRMQNENEPTDISKALEKADELIAAEKKSDLPHEKIAEASRTYASDIAETMRREKGSIIKIALAEQSRRDEYKKKRDPTSTKNMIVVMLGLILIVGGVMIFVYSYLNREKPVAVTNFNSPLPSFLFTENQVQIDATILNRTELLNAIENQVGNQDLEPGTINNLYLSYKSPSGQVQLPATTFFQKLGIDVRDVLFQNLFPSFMLGVYNQPENNKLFVILKVKDFNETFLAMREFEDTMLTNFLRLFRIDTSAYGKAIFSKAFETQTLFNKEARVLLDPAGKTILSYIFLDPSTVMITTSTEAVEEVIKRMNLQTVR